MVVHYMLRGIVMINDMQVTTNIPMSQREAYQRGHDTGVKAADFEVWKLKSALEMNGMMTDELSTLLKLLHDDIKKLITKQATDE